MIPDSLEGEIVTRFSAYAPGLPAFSDTCESSLIVPPLVLDPQAAVESHGVRLAWRVGSAAVRNATLYRRVDGGTWSAIAELAVQGGALGYVDEDPRPACRSPTGSASRSRAENCSVA